MTLAICSSSILRCSNCITFISTPYTLRITSWASTDSTVLLWESGLSVVWVVVLVDIPVGVKLAIAYGRAYQLNKIQGLKK